MLTKTKTLLLAISLLSIFHLEAFELKKGTFKGETQNGEKFYLMLKEARGSKGSFLAVLSNWQEKRKKFGLYIVDPTTNAQYTFSPIILDEMGNLIYLRGERPELILNTNEDGMAITPNSPNGPFADSKINFEGDMANDFWSSLRSTNYQWGANSKALEIYGFDKKTERAMASFDSKAFSSKRHVYVLKENGIYAIHETNVLEDRRVVLGNAIGLGIFITDYLCCEKNDIHAFVLNPLTHELKAHFVHD